MTSIIAGGGVMVLKEAHKKLFRTLAFVEPNCYTLHNMREEFDLSPGRL